MTREDIDAWEDLYEAWVVQLFEGTFNYDYDERGEENDKRNQEKS